MTVDLLKILNDESRSFIAQVQAKIPNATGKTAKSLRYEISEGSARIILEVLGKPFFAVVETGRKATPDKKPSRAMIENITEWCNAKGKPESAVWAIAVYIQKHGTALFRKGGRTDVYTDSKEVFADKIFQDVTNTLADEIFKQATVAFQ